MIGAIDIENQANKVNQMTESSRVPGPPQPADYHRPAIKYVVVVVGDRTALESRFLGGLAIITLLRSCSPDQLEEAGYAYSDLRRPCQSRQG